MRSGDMDDTTRSTNEPSGEQNAPKADETFTWTDEPGTSGNGAGDDAKATAANVIESLREAVDDLAVKAGPTVREISARAAELTATAAVKAAPLVKRAGEVTADASQKLAEKSRAWAADLRTSSETHPDTATSTAVTPSDLAAETPTASTATDPAPPFETTAEAGQDEREGNTPGI
jgi:hypothetical protein